VPQACFNYPADVPPSLPGLRRMPLICFSYPADVAPGPEKMGYPCFSYPAMCFSYPADAPPAPSGLRKMPTTTCFRY
jgi:hypothetical protein